MVSLLMLGCAPPPAHDDAGSAIGATGAVPWPAFCTAGETCYARGLWLDTASRLWLAFWNGPALHVVRTTIP